MDNKEPYKKILNRLIKKQIVLLGVGVAVSAARAIHGIKVADDGTVMDIISDEKEIAKLVSDAYVSLSGQNIGV